MDYSTINPNKQTIINPFDKNSGKELLQYAVGALLYMPGTTTKIAGKILDHQIPNVKSLVLCLEDSIGDSVVEHAENCVKRTVDTLADAIKSGKFNISDLPLIFVRVREPGQMSRIFSKIGSNISVITGFVIPKFNPDHADDYITEFELINDQCDSDLYIMPIIESRDVMYKPNRYKNLEYVYNALKRISDSVLCIRVGGTDFCNIFGIRRPIDSSIWDIHVVSDCIADIVNIFGTDYVVSGPTWEYFENKDNVSDTTWSDGLKKELVQDRLNGIVGKTCIHPSQLPIVQGSLVVPYADYQNAIAVLGLSGQSFVGVKKSVAGNQMNETKTHLNWAKKVVALAGIYGVKNE